jgi:hypothetical protein
MSHYLVETFVPAGHRVMIQASPRHTPGGSDEISCRRTAASAKANRAHSMSGCRLDGGSSRACGERRVSVYALNLRRLEVRTMTEGIPSYTVARPPHVSRRRPIPVAAPDGRRRGKSVDRLRGTYPISPQPAHRSCKDSRHGASTAARAGRSSRVRDAPLCIFAQARTSTGKKTAGGLSFPETGWR